MVRSSSLGAERHQPVAPSRLPFFGNPGSESSNNAAPIAPYQHPYGEAAGDVYLYFGDVMDSPKEEDHVFAFVEGHRKLSEEYQQHLKEYQQLLKGHQQLSKEY